MGGYGENLRSREAGYHIRSTQGITRVLELRQINVPVISTPCAFRQLIASTKDMSRSVAIVEHIPVMCDSSSRYDTTHFEEEKSFYTIVYEKRTHSDALYIYTSGMPNFDLDYVKTYFRSKFFMFEPDKIRQSLEISDLYAIQDAKYLASNMKVHIEAPMLLKGMRHQFYLNEVFMYNEKRLLQDHVTTIIDAISSPSPLAKP